MKVRGGILAFAVMGIILAAALFAWGGTGDLLVDGKADQVVTGKPFIIKVNSNTGVTLSGTTVFGAGITGVSNPERPPAAGISLFAVPPSGGENFWVYNRDNTATTGTTLYFIPGSDVTVISNVPCTGGVSKYVISGTPLQKKLIIWSDEPGTYVIDAVGGPTVEAK